MLAFALAALTLPRVFAGWSIVYDWGHDIWTARGDGSHAHLVVREGRDPCWSPDRRWIAFVRGGAVEVGRREGGPPNRVYRVSGADTIRGLTWGRIVMGERWKRRDRSPMTSLVANVVTGATCRSVELRMKGGRVVDTSEIDLGDPGNHVYEPGPMAWAASGDAFVFCAVGDVWLGSRVEGRRGESGWDETRLAAVATYDNPSYRADRSHVLADRLSIGPTGRLIAFERHEEGHPGVYDVGTFEFLGLPATTEPMQPQIHMLVATARDPSVSPDERWILATCPEEGLATWLEAYSADGKQRYRLLPGAEGCW